MLHVRAKEALADDQPQKVRTLAITVSESIRLALSNLKLQEVLRDSTL